MTRAAAIDMPSPVRSRVRASENAIRAALKAVLETGLSVDKVCVNGGQVEIHCGGVEGPGRPAKDEGLEKW